MIFSRTNWFQIGLFLALFAFLVPDKALAQLSGTKSIGPTGDYATLTAAFSAITTNGLSGAVILELQSTYTSATETFPIVPSTNTTAVHTITVRPATGATGLVIEDLNFLETTFSINGASYVTIDGRPGGTGTSNQLAIKSTGGFGVALQLTNDATNNVVKFCTIYAPGGFFTVSLDASVSSGNSNNLFSDCVIGGDAANPASTGLILSGTSGTPNVNNTVVRCDIVDCVDGIDLETEVRSTLIDSCNFYTTSPISATGTVGILVNEALSTTVQCCKFYNLSCSNLNPVNILGILINGGSGAGSSTTIKNNFFSLDAVSTTDPANVKAILYASAGASDTCRVFFNTIYIGGSGITGGSSWGIQKSTAASVFSQENNIVINARSNAAGTGTHYAVVIDNTTGVGTVNYNDYLSTGTGGVLGSWNSVDKTTLGAWQAASSRDANSTSTAVTFAPGANNLHLFGGSLGDLSLSGTPIGGITTDIDGETRNISVPYMGADENLANPLPVQISMFTATALALNAQLRWTTATETNNYGFEIERREMGQGKSTAGWVNVGFVHGGGTSSSPREYSFVDKDISFGRYAYRLKQVDLNGQFAYVGSAEIEIGLAPKELTLSRNYPNPFNPTTSIQFTLPQDGRATLKIYDAVGREVATLFDGEAQGGRYYRVNFDAGRLSSGIYFSRLEFGGKQQVGTMLLVK